MKARTFAVGGLFIASTTLADATPEASLNTCQATVKTETANFIKSKVAAVNACLQKMADELIGDNQTTDVAATNVASACVTQFRKIHDTRTTPANLGAKLGAKVAKKCTPGNSGVTHVLGDITGVGPGVAQPIDTMNIDSSCANFGGGDGEIGSVAEWTDCLAAAAECAADLSISTQYPRALEWLGLVRAKMLLLTAPSGDPDKINDAVAGLDAVEAAIDGTAVDGQPSIQCGGSSTCPSDLATCSGDLGTCNSNYSSCSGDLGTCNTSYSSCSADLGACNAGTATAADVLSGKTFSSSGGLGQTGTAPAGANVTGGNGSPAMTIPAGLYDGTETCTASDTNLVAENIKAGTGIFGVTGSLACGNGAIDAAEQCDLGNLNGQTCATVTPATPLGMIQCEAGCVFDTTACVARFVDNGNGTVTDKQTQLIWEKKDSTCPGPHCVNTVYNWNGGVTSFVTALNGGAVGVGNCVSGDGFTQTGGFAGHCDWRLPTLPELTTILVPGSDPAISPVFGTTRSDGYWSATTDGLDTSYAYVTFFDSPFSLGLPKFFNFYVRAVRGGS